MQWAFGLLRRNVRPYRRQLPAEFWPCLFQNLSDALEGDGQRFEILRFADRLDSLGPPHRVHEIVGSRSERRVDFIIGQAASLFQDEPRTLKNEVHHLFFNLYFNNDFWRQAA